MEKGQSMSGGQLLAQKYWHLLLEAIDAGELDATWLFSHRFHLNDIAKAYKTFANHEDNCTKVILKTDFGLQVEQQQQGTVKGPTTAGKPFGRLEMAHKPVGYSGKPLHLRNAKGPQAHSGVGSTGTSYSELLQGGTNSNMGTNTYGAKSSAPGSSVNA